MDIDKFIKCHGLLKKEMLKKFTNRVKMDKDFYAFELKNGDIVLISWNNEKTIVFRYLVDSMILELWHTGKQLFKRMWKHTDKPALFSACLEFYTAQESLANTEWENFLM